MDSDFNKLKKIYENLLLLNSKVKKELEDYNEQKIELLLTKKSELLKGLGIIKKEAKLTSDEQIQLDKIVEEIKKLEDENIKTLSESKNEVSKKISGLNKNSRVLSAYKIPHENKPRLFDQKE